MTPTPDAACGRLPLKGATPAARQSRIRGMYLGMPDFVGPGLRDEQWSN